MPQKRLLLLAFVLTIGLFSALVGCGGPMQSSPSRSVSFEGDWAILYHDLKSLKQASDGAVEGSIARVVDTTAIAGGLPVTDFEFAISRIIFSGKSHIQGNSILLRQEGGTANGASYQADDDPLFQIGEQAILFLLEYTPGHFRVVGGPSGRFRVQNGQVTPINDEGIKFASPLSEATFIASIQNT